MDPEDKDYVCTLDEASLQVAKTELNEMPSDRLGSVKAFRKWILEQTNLKCPTDTKFLLLFLRVAKFSQIAAREKLQGYLTMKTQLPELYDNIDTHDPCLLAVLKSGWALPLGYDPYGRCTFMYRDGALETDNRNYKFSDMWHAGFTFMHYVLDDERAVVNGVNWVADMTNHELRHFMFEGVDGIQKAVKIFQNHFPLRIKGFHVYNGGEVFEKMFAVMTPLMSKKLRDRTHLHGDKMENVYKFFPKSMLPREYLPDDYVGPCAGTIQEITDKLIADITSPEWRQKMLLRSSPEWQNDQTSQ